MFKNICLIGVPTAGKTTLGRISSVICSKGFIDVDKMINYKYNKSLKHLIDELKFMNSENSSSLDSSIRFLNIENNICKTIHAENTIISTGGSMVYNEESIYHLKHNLNCKIIHLYLNFKEFSKRTMLPNTFQNRGIINPSNLNLQELYLERIKLCTHYSDNLINVNNSENGLKELVREIKTTL